MTPPIQKDWWLAAALTGAALPAAMGQMAPTAESRPTGIVTSVTQGAPTTGVSAPIYVNNTRGQRLVTGPDQSIHVLFSDQSAITVGPNSDLVITEYRYDPESKEGNLLVTLAQGTVRVVGGFISKKNETVVRTDAAEVGIRGGITVVEHQNGRTNSLFLFGEQMRVSNANNPSQQEIVTRQGFGITAQNDQLSSPQRTPANEFTGLVGRLETSSQGGSVQQPAAAPAPAPAPAPGIFQPLPVGSLANDRVPQGQIPNQTTNINPTDTLRNILGTGPAPNQS